MTTAYRHFACPNCLRLTTKPWREAWCACEPVVSVQAFDPNDSDELVWTQMVELVPGAVRATVDAAKWWRSSVNEQRISTAKPRAKRRLRLRLYTLKAITHYLRHGSHDQRGITTIRAKRKSLKD